ncbi:meiosis-specific transcription factor ndt80 [Apophysomyces sp. BC1034]|nr:meiosis-specific transcription factor ndt80 [Apophysomyces sp. BC1015]KAG0183488.1 meiosis-specific transcription factor ndt80 [Apophysomyces sp. BC1021]KAG0194509.1 meiosis-specific transcription factor ndt80 [Apophysomyces sp. BC1034]
MERGLFLSDANWTCYRRNYFQLTGMLVLQSPAHSILLSNHKPVRQFFLKLTASTSENRPVELIQLTPKRDKGPRTTPPSLAIQPGEWATFRRIQFKTATANNGKKRSSQQYFSLVMDLVAELDDASQETIARCQSVPIVVRGRSPSHYGEIYPYTRKRLFDGEITSRPKRMITAATTKEENVSFDHTRSLSANDYHTQNLLVDSNSSSTSGWELCLPSLAWSSHERTESTNTYTSVDDPSLADYPPTPYHYTSSFTTSSVSAFAMEDNGMLG